MKETHSSVVLATVTGPSQIDDDSCSAWRSPAIGEGQVLSARGTQHCTKQDQVHIIIVKIKHRKHARSDFHHAVDSTKMKRSHRRLGLVSTDRPAESKR